MDNLESKLKAEIIELLNLEEMDINDFENDAILFSDEGLGLDSIDALELIVLLEKEYGLKIASPEEGGKIFQSIDTIAAYIRENKA